MFQKVLLKPSKIFTTTFYHWFDIIEEHNTELLELF